MNAKHRIAIITSKNKNSDPNDYGHPLQLFINARSFEQESS